MNVGVHHGMREKIVKTTKVHYVTQTHAKMVAPVKNLQEATTCAIVYQATMVNIVKNKLLSIHYVIRIRAKTMAYVECHQIVTYTSANVPQAIRDYDVKLIMTIVRVIHV